MSISHVCGAGIDKPTAISILFASRMILSKLYIEHLKIDLATQKATFDRFARKRADAGVTAHRIIQPVDDPADVVVQLASQPWNKRRSQRVSGNACGRPRRTLPAYRGILSAGARDCRVIE